MRLENTQSSGRPGEASALYDFDQLFKSIPATHAISSSMDNVRICEQCYHKIHDYRARVNNLFCLSWNQEALTLTGDYYEPRTNRPMHCRRTRCRRMHCQFTHIQTPIIATRHIPSS